MECKNCQGLCVKKGCQNRRQKYYCKNCKLYQQKTYTYKLCTVADEQIIVKLNNIGVGISGIAVFMVTMQGDSRESVSRMNRQNEEDKRNNEYIVLYRGVSFGHPAYIAATQGMAVPWSIRWEHQTAENHVGGNYKNIYTSWTMFRTVSDFHANKGGRRPLGPGSPSGF